MTRQPARLLTKLKYLAYSPYVLKGDWNGKDRILLKSLKYRLPDGTCIVMPKGYVTDLGSVPSILHGLVDDNDESIPGFIIHDYLWHKDCPVQLPRKEVNAILGDLMVQFKQSWWRRTKTTLGVKLGRIAVPFHYNNARVHLEYANDVLVDLREDDTKKCKTCEICISCRTLT